MTKREVERVAVVELNPKSTQCGDLLRTASHAGSKRPASAGWQAPQFLKRDVMSFGRAYTFLSRIFDYADAALENERSSTRACCRSSNPTGSARAPIFSQVVLTHQHLRTPAGARLPCAAASPYPPRRCAKRVRRRRSGHSVEKKRSGAGVVAWRAVEPYVRPVSEWRAAQ